MSKIIKITIALLTSMLFLTACTTSISTSTETKLEDQKKTYS